MRRKSMLKLRENAKTDVTNRRASDFSGVFRRYNDTLGDPGAKAALKFQYACARESVVSNENLLRADGNELDALDDDEALVFVYGTLRRGYCNSYNFEIPGIQFRGEAETAIPVYLFLDPENRNRPCLAEACVRQWRYEQCPRVKGEIFSVRKDLLNAVDEFERVPDHYIRLRIPVQLVHPSCCCSPEQGKTLGADDFFCNFKGDLRDEDESASCNSDLEPDHLHATPSVFCKNCFSKRGRLFWANAYFIKVTPDLEDRLNREQYAALPEYTKTLHQETYVAREGNNRGKHRMSGLLNLIKA